MPNSKKSLRPELFINDQWQHKESKETVFITGMYEEVGSADILTVYFITEYNIRSNLDVNKFLSEYSPVPPMKGAYK